MWPLLRKNKLSPLTFETMSPQGCARLCHKISKSYSCWVTAEMYALLTYFPNFTWYRIAAIVSLLTPLISWSTWKKSTIHACKSCFVIESSSKSPWIFFACFEEMISKFQISFFLCKFPSGKDLARTITISFCINE